jgi:hypothetical protein
MKPDEAILYAALACGMVTIVVLAAYLYSL